MGIDDTRSRPWPSRRGHGGLLIMVLIVLAVVLLLYFGNFGGGGGGGSYAERLSQTRKDGQSTQVRLNTQQLMTMIVQYKLANDRLPRTMEDLEAPPGAFADAWGRPITFEFGEARGPGPAEVTFRSAGPDGEFNTEDDVVVVERMPV